MIVGLVVDILNLLLNTLTCVFTGSAVNKFKISFYYKGAHDWKSVFIL